VHCSMTERRADDATRDVTTWLKCEYMRHRVGEEHDGLVSGVAPFGLFVELSGLYVDGLIHVSQLKNDYYQFESRHHRLIGERSGVAYNLGDRVRVRVVRVNLDERKIDLELVQTAPTSNPPGKRSSSVNAGRPESRPASQQPSKKKRRSR